MEGNRASVKSGPQRNPRKSPRKKTVNFGEGESTYRGPVRDLAEAMFALHTGRPHSIRKLRKCFTGCLFCSLASNALQRSRDGMVLISKNSSHTLLHLKQVGTFAANNRAEKGFRGNLGISWVKLAEGAGKCRNLCILLQAWW